MDCYGDDEQLQAFENALDEDGSFPCPGVVVGQDVEVVSVGTRVGRHGLIARCRCDGVAYDVALLDVRVDADPVTAGLIGAYRRWIGS